MELMRRVQKEVSRLESGQDASPDAVETLSAECDQFAASVKDFKHQWRYEAIIQSMKPGVDRWSGYPAAQLHRIKQFLLQRSSFNVEGPSTDLVYVHTVSFQYVDVVYIADPDDDRFSIRFQCDENVDVYDPWIKTEAERTMLRPTDGVGSDMIMEKSVNTKRFLQFRAMTQMPVQIPHKLLTDVMLFLFENLVHLSLHAGFPFLCRDLQASKQFVPDSLVSACGTILDAHLPPPLVEVVFSFLQPTYVTSVNDYSDIDSDETDPDYDGHDSENDLASGSDT